MYKYSIVFPPYVSCMLKILLYMSTTLDTLRVSKSNKNFTQLSFIDWNTVMG